VILDEEAPLHVVGGWGVEAYLLVKLKRLRLLQQR